MGAPRQTRPLIVKLGGSLAGKPELMTWIAALDRCSAPLIVVPGGGPFAETVRVTQTTIGFDDEAAHHMALLAMHQYGLALASLWPRIACVERPAAIRRAMRLGQVACWNPAPMALAAPLPKSWNITSDTLAAWLAAEMGSDRLVLIKSIDIANHDETALTDLAAARLVDPLFPHYAAASGAAIYIAGPAALAGAGPLLLRGDAPGHRIRLT